MLNQAEPGSPAGKIIDISAAEYQTIQQFLSQSCGIELGDKQIKKYNENKKKN